MERERERQAERSKSQRAVREREITMAISFMVNERYRRVIAHSALSS